MKAVIKPRPSPATVIAVLALAFSIGGSAIARTGGQRAKLSRADVRSIAKKEVRMLAPTLSVHAADVAFNVASGGVRGNGLGEIDTVKSTSGPITNGSVGSASVQCPAGSTLISGGGASSGGGGFVFTTGSRKSDPNGWVYGAYDSGAANATVTAEAYCLAP